MTRAPHPTRRDDVPLDETTVRSLTVLNMSGHSTMAWGPEADEVMRAAIEKKMAEGFSFFVMERRWNGLLPDRRVAISDADAAMASRRVSMSDELFADIVSSGAVQLVRTPGERPGGTPVMARDPALIARSQAYAVRHPFGG